MRPPATRRAAERCAPKMHGHPLAKEPYKRDDILQKSPIKETILYMYATSSYKESCRAMRAEDARPEGAFWLLRCDQFAHCACACCCSVYCRVCFSVLQCVVACCSVLLLHDQKVPFGCSVVISVCIVPVCVVAVCVLVCFCLVCFCVFVLVCCSVLQCVVISLCIVPVYVQCICSVCCSVL